MKILEFTAKSFRELIVLRAAKDVTRDTNCLNGKFQPQISEESKTNFQKYLALFQDEYDSNIDKLNDLSILKVLVLQYLPESNCGFVRFLEFGEKKGDYGLNCGWGQSLVNEAEIILNKEAEKNGFQKVCEIFYQVTADFNSTTGFHFSCLHNIGFRLVETEHLCGKISSQDNNSHLLVYRPCLIPDFQVENGILPGQIKTTIILQFLKELLASIEHVKSGFNANDIEELQVLIRNWEKDATSKVFIRTSFPWHGRAGPCPDNQVAIVGGGMSGLAAAASLSEAGFDVVLLEAANYLGGRVKQEQPFKGFPPVDLGGEFIHGSDSIINRIAKENGWLVQPCHGCEEMESENMFYHKGELHPLLSDHPDIKKAWKAWDEIIFLWEKKNKDNILERQENSDKRGKDILLPKDDDKAKEDKKSNSASNSVDIVADLEKTQGAERRENAGHDDLRPSLAQDGDMTVLEWLKRRKCNEDVIAVFESMYCQTVAATPSQMGVLESAREESAWEYGDGNYRLVESYSQLVKYLLQKCTKVDKRLSWQVKEINWKGNIVQSTDKTDPGGNILLKNQHGEILSAKYVVVTVPLTILKDGDITFIPALPADKKRAIDSIQMRGALKIVCRFNSQFWPDELNLIYSVRGFVSQIWIYTCDSVESDEKCHVIAGFQTSEPAEEKSCLSGKDVLDGFLQQLDGIFSTDSNPHPATDSFMDYVYYHWSNHPFIRGGYSSPTAHAQGMRHVLGIPVEDRLFFAGEATSVTGCATVHTAMETGFRAASEVCSLAERVHTDSN